MSAFGEKMVSGPFTRAQLARFVGASIDDFQLYEDRACFRRRAGAAAAAGTSAITANTSTVSASSGVP